MRLIIRLVLVALFRVIFTECFTFLNVEYSFVIEEDIAEGGIFFLVSFFQLMEAYINSDELSMNMSYN